VIYVASCFSRNKLSCASPCLNADPGPPTEDGVLPPVGRGTVFSLLTARFSSPPTSRGPIHSIHPISRPLSKTTPFFFNSPWHSTKVSRASLFFTVRNFFPFCSPPETSVFHFTHFPLHGISLFSPIPPPKSLVLIILTQISQGHLSFSGLLPIRL